MKKTLIFGLTIVIGLMSCKKEEDNPEPETSTQSPTVTYDWSSVLQFPGIARSEAVSFVIGNDAYVGLGDYISALGAQSFPKDFYKFDQSTGNWSKKSDFPGEGRQEAISFVLDGYGYVGLGSNANSSERLQDIWKYDPSNDSWKQLGDFPISSYYRTDCFVVNSVAYAISGRLVYAYDPISDSWNEKSNFPGFSRSHGVTFVIGSFAYYGLGFEDQDYYNDIWKYDFVNDSWTQLSDFPGNYRASSVSFAIDGKGFVGTGMHYWFDRRYKDFYSYTPSTDIWTLESNEYPEGAGGQMTSFVIGDEAYVGTGYFESSFSYSYSKKFYRIKGN